MNSHLKKHILFYLGLAQQIAGAAALAYPGAAWVSYALFVSGLSTQVAQYVKANWPDDTSIPTQPAAPAKVPTT